MVKKKVSVEKVEYDQKKVSRTAVRMVTKTEMVTKLIPTIQPPVGQCGCFQQQCGCLGQDNCNCCQPKCDCAPEYKTVQVAKETQVPEEYTHIELVRIPKIVMVDTFINVPQEYFEEFTEEVPYVEEIMKNVTYPVIEDVPYEVTEEKTVDEIVEVEVPVEIEVLSEVSVPTTV